MALNEKQKAEVEAATRKRFGPDVVLVWPGEVHVTPEMIEAGARVLRGMTMFYGADEEDWAERVYTAMHKARR